MNFATEANLACQKLVGEGHLDLSFLFFYWNDVILTFLSKYLLYYKSRLFFGENALITSPSMILEKYILKVDCICLIL